MNKTVTRQVRDVSMTLLASNRSLELCSQMNYETENLDFIDDAAAGEVFYDLGACEGRFSTYAALKNLKVYSFEPESRNHAALQENLKLNNLDGASITAFRKAVGNVNGSATMDIGQPWEGGHHKVVDTGSKQELIFEPVEKQTIEVIRLDDFIKAMELPLPRYLKVDVDGSEVEFIEGAEKTLAEPGVKGVLFELDIESAKFSVVMNKLAGFGFTEAGRFIIPNEKSLYNIRFRKN
jgi:FkbM family methyltransferase